MDFAPWEWHVLLIGPAVEAIENLSNRTKGKIRTRR
jgi:hypothetical protein